jgi:hypothetical protein
VEGGGSLLLVGLTDEVEVEREKFHCCGKVEWVGGSGFGVWFAGR